MVYSSIVDGYVKGIMVSCCCGCSNMEIKILGDEAFISVFQSSFYSHQGLSTIHDNAKHIITKILKNQKPILCDLMMSREEVLKFIKLGKELEFDSEFVKDEDDVVIENDSSLALDYIWSYDWPVAFDNYTLQVRSSMSNFNLMRGKGFRGYEICLKKDDWYALMDKMEKYVSYVDSRYANRKTEL